MPAPSTPADLLTHPLWRAEDLGRPVPDSPHAVSACLPTWRDNVGYEEQEPRVMQRLTTGYPRFVYNRLCRDLFVECERRFARAGESCLAFPSRRSAEQFAEFVQRRGDCEVRLCEFGRHGIWAACFSSAAAATAKSFWQHCGVGVSSRQAQAALEGRDPPDGRAAKQTIRERIAGVVHVPPDSLYLCPSGMSALFLLHRVLSRLFPERKTVQFGFPYVDGLKVQQCYGPGVHFYPKGDAADLAALSGVIRREPIGAICTELPTNPLLTSPDLRALRRLADEAGCPLVVDDTVASFANVDVLPVADVSWSSLTKYFSGRGDAMGGVLVVNPDSRFAGRITPLLQEEWEDLLWSEDAIRLAENSADFRERVAAINTTAERLADFLAGHPAVAQVHYPKFRTPELYRAFLRPGGGYGGLLSVEVHDGPRNAARFFDALHVSKGPNLGTSYTLACPFTILAHYNELDFAERCGVSRWLVRVAVGMEGAEELIGRFGEALGVVEW
jgi:cystathionine gamma-synthase